MTRPAGRAKARDLWIDGLRFLALVRILTYLCSGWAILPLLFPSVGVLFALAGSLMAASLDKRRPSLWLYYARFKRLLIPFWAFAAVVVPVMWWLGWDVTEEAGRALTWATAWAWVVPLVSPPASATGAAWVAPVWYLVTYVWLLLVAPATLWLYRRWPRTTIGLPLVGVVFHSAGFLPLEGPLGVAAMDALVYLGCWCLGYAHRDGDLRKLDGRVAVLLGIGLIVAGISWAYLYPDPFEGSNIAEIPLASALHSLGFTLVLLKFRVPTTWVRRVPYLVAMVRTVSTRSLTLYLWAGLCAFLSWKSLTLTPVRDYVVPLLGQGGAVAMSYIALLVTVASLCGWLEDFAATKRASQRIVAVTPPQRRAHRAPGRHADR